MTEVVIVDALRTATGRRKGMFADTHPVDMLTPILKELVERNDIPAGDVEEVVTGCVTMTDEQGGNIGRMAVLAAGFRAPSMGVIYRVQVPSCEDRSNS